MSSYIYVVTRLFSNLFKEALNTTGYSVCRLCIISKLLILQVLGVPCTVLDILRACLHGGGGPQVGEVTPLGGVKQ